MTPSTDPRHPRPFGAGFAWLLAAWALLRGHAVRLLLMGLLFQLLGGASQMGILGVLFLLAVPALTAGMLQGAHLAATGGRPSAITLFAAFQDGRRLLALFLLGAFTILGTFLLVGFSAAGALAGLDPELLARLQAGDQQAVLELDPAIIRNVLLSMVGGLFLGACLGFFAIPLVWFQGRSLGDALVTGVVVLLRQWRALTALGIGLAAVGLPVGALVVMVVATQPGGGMGSAVMTGLLLAVVVAYQVYGFVAQYVAFRDVFMSQASPAGMNAPDESGGDDQLVA